MTQERNTDNTPVDDALMNRIIKGLEECADHGLVMSGKPFEHTFFEYARMFAYLIATEDEAAMQELRDALKGEEARTEAAKGVSND